MSCDTANPGPGPSLTLYRDSVSDRLWRAYKEAVPYNLIAGNVEVRLVIADSKGTDAVILAVLASTDTSQIEIRAEPNDSYFTTFFAPSIFAALPEADYYYAIWGYDLNGNPFPLTLPATLTVVESIGPPPL